MVVVDEEGSGCGFLKLKVVHVLWVSWIFSGFVYEYVFSLIFNSKVVKFWIKLDGKPNLQTSVNVKDVFCNFLT